MINSYTSKNGEITVQSYKNLIKQVKTGKMNEGEYNYFDFNEMVIKHEKENNMKCKICNSIPFYCKCYCSECFYDSRSCDCGYKPIVVIKKF